MADHVLNLRIGDPKLYGRTSNKLRSLTDMELERKPVLLIAEDEEDLREVLIEICADLPIEIISVSNGIESLKLCMEGKVDAVLSDINMPGHTGLEVLHKIRCQGIETPYIVLTAYGDKRNVTNALQLGANDFLDKPFNDEALLGSLQRALVMGQVIRQSEETLKAKMKQLQIPAEEIDAHDSARRKLSEIRYSPLDPKAMKYSN